MIFTLCIDPERGRYIAFHSDDCNGLSAFSSNSEAEAVGFLITNNPALEYTQVISVNTSEA